MFRNGLQRFFIGRNGPDQLCRFTSLAALVLFIITLFTHSGILYIIALALIIYSYFRMMSKNVQKRYLENQRYLQVSDRVKSFFKNIWWKPRAAWTEFTRRVKYGSNQAQEKRREKAQYKIFKCPDCGQKIRIPRGHGTVEITCPKCQRIFRGRT